MRLTDVERDKLLLSYAAELAWRRRRRGVLGRDDVMDGIAEMLREIQVEATFPDGTKLVTIHEPIP